MEIFKKVTHINFVGSMKLNFTLSIITIIISVGSLLWHGGLNYGIDFAGGTLVQVKFQQGTTTEKLRQTLDTIKLGGSTIQQFSPQEFVIRTAESTTDIKGLSSHIEESLTTAYGKGSFEVRRVEVVGPKVGKDLTKKAILAVCFSWLAMLLYIAWRFEFRYGVGGIVALIHDVIICIGALSIFNKEFSLTIVAALLTIIGYSINDTIVVCDRIRENVRKSGKKDLGEIINTSINETLSRTILSSLTVFIVVVVLFFLGGEVIHDFAFILLIGVFVGTYSSIFIATPIVLVWERISPSKMRRR